MRRTALRFAAVTLLGAAPGLAAGPLGQDGAQLTTSQYTIDLTATPVIGGARVTGLAGAYVAIAEGTDGSVQTPAAPGVRPAYSVDHFDYDLGLGLSLASTLTSTNFFNTGSGRTQLANPAQEGFVFFTPAVQLQWGNLGVGLMAEIQNYGLGRSRTSRDTALAGLDAEFVLARLQFAHMFFDRQLVLGAGVRVSTLSIADRDGGGEGATLFSADGAGLEFGAVWTPENLPLRVGAAFRTKLTAQIDPASSIQATESGDRVIGDPNDPQNALWLPSRVTSPWNMNVGVALQMGDRKMNPRWIDPRDAATRLQREAKLRAERRRAAKTAAIDRAAPGRARSAAEAGVAAELETEEAIEDLRLLRGKRETREELKRRYSSLPRSYVLLAASLVITGAVDDAVGIESFLQRTVARSGQEVTFSPRLGVETEVIPHWLKLRGGTYGEPSRFVRGNTRWHGTFGFDVKLFPWAVFGLFDQDTEWRFGAAIDVAREYLSWGLSIGVWH